MSDYETHTKHNVYCIFITIKAISYLVHRLCCISPVLAAKVLLGVDVTVGHEEEEGGRWPYAGTTQAITALGAKHTVKEVTISLLYTVDVSRAIGFYCLLYD